MLRWSSAMYNSNDVTDTMYAKQISVWSRPKHSSASHRSSTLLSLVLDDVPHRKARLSPWNSGTREIVNATISAVRDHMEGSWYRTPGPRGSRTGACRCATRVPTIATTRRHRVVEVTAHAGPDWKHNSTALSARVLGTVATAAGSYRSHLAASLARLAARNPASPLRPSVLKQQQSHTALW